MTAPDRNWLIERLTAIQEELAELRKTTVGSQTMQVTSVDSTAGLIHGLLPDGQTATAHAFNTQLLPAVGQQIRIRIEGSTPVYEPAGIAANAVTGREIANGTVTVEKTAQSLIDALGGAKIYRQVGQPVDPTNGLPAYWWEPEAGGGNRLRQFNYTTSAWDVVQFGNGAIDPNSLIASNVLVEGTVSATLLEAVMVLATAVVLGNPNGVHTLLGPTGLTYQAVDSEGIPYTAQRFGKDAAGTDASGNVIWEINENADATFNTVTSNSEPIFMGLPFGDHVNPKSEFHAGASRGSHVTPAMTPSGGGETTFIEMTDELEAGHVYELKTNNIWVRPNETGTNRIDLNLRYTYSLDPAVDPPAVGISSPLYARSPVHVQGNVSTIGGPAQIQRILSIPQYIHFRWLISLYSTGGQAYIAMSGSQNHTGPFGAAHEVDLVQLWVEDKGEHPWTNRAATNTSSTSGGGTDPAPAPVKRYSFTYFPLWTRRFRGDNTVHSDGGDAVQGQTPYYTSNGNQKTQIGDFRRTTATTTTLKSDLNGATVEKLEVYLYAKTWHYAGGGTGIIRYHNNVGPTSYANVSSAYKSVGGWGRSVGKWINITDWGSAFAGTGAAGIQVGPGLSTDPGYYGTFGGHNAGSYKPLIRATFTK